MYFELHTLFSFLETWQQRFEVYIYCLDCVFHFTQTPLIFHILYDMFFVCFSKDVYSITLSSLMPCLLYLDVSLSTSANLSHALIYSSSNACSTLRCRSLFKTAADHGFLFFHHLKVRCHKTPKPKSWSIF